MLDPIQRTPPPAVLPPSVEPSSSGLPVEVATRSSAGALAGLRSRSRSTSPERAMPARASLPPDTATPRAIPPRGGEGAARAGSQRLDAAPSTLEPPSASTRADLAPPPADAGDPRPDVPAAQPVHVAEIEMAPIAAVELPDDPAAPRQRPQARPLPRRRALLQDYRQATQREFDMERALAAVKVRCAAEIYCPKNGWARVVPRALRAANGRALIDELAALPADALIDRVRANPQRFSRTLLTNVAQRHLVAALEFDEARYRRGIKRAARYEGAHSVAGRAVSFTAAAVSLGASYLPGAGHVWKAVRTAVRVAAHEAPPNLVNPMLTGTLRSVTDVKQAFKREGGQPVVAAQIEQSPDMGAIVRAIHARRGTLSNALKAFRDDPTDAQSLGNLVDAFVALHQLADVQYRRRIGLNRTQTYSKAWGTAVNGVAAAGTVVSAAIPVVGPIAGTAILAATMPLQWGAGYLDERRNKHRYNFRANTKWADFLDAGAASVHFMDLRPEHLSRAALQRSFATQPEIQVAAIREVYEDAIGELVGRRTALDERLGALTRAGASPRKIRPQREERLRLDEQVARLVAQAGDFESFDEARWQAIPADSVIGRCLDDIGRLERANRQARLRKPSERAQIVQRYAQAFHAGVSTGTALPIVDAITSTDRLYEHDSHGHPTHLEPRAEVGTVTTGVVGGAVFTGATGEVRMSKSANKLTLAGLRVSEERYRAGEADWVVEAGGRRVDLRQGAAYRRQVHSVRDEAVLIGRAMFEGVTSGPVGLFNLLRATWWPRGELRQAKAALRDTLDVLTASPLERARPAGASRADNMSAMKDELYDYPLIRDHLAERR